MGGEIGGLVYLLVYLLVGALIVWLAFYALGQMNLREPFRTVVLVIIVLIILIFILRQLGIFL